MSITAGSLYRDTGNFLRNQRLTVVLIALFAALVHTLLGQALAPAPEQLLSFSSATESGSTVGLLEMVNNLSEEERRTLLQLSASATLSALVGNTLLLGGMLQLLTIVSSGKNVSALQAVGASAPRLPRLLLLAFIMTLVIQLGFAMFVLPGIILAVLLALSPVILYSEKTGIFSSLNRSARLSWANLKLVSPVVAYWILAKLLLLLLASRLTFLPEQAATIVLSTLSNLISAALLIYFFRLYMLLRN